MLFVPTAAHHQPRALPHPLGAVRVPGKFHRANALVTSAWRHVYRAHKAARNENCFGVSVAVSEAGVGHAWCSLRKNFVTALPVSRLIVFHRAQGIKIYTPLPRPAMFGRPERLWVSSRGGALARHPVPRRQAR